MPGWRLELLLEVRQRLDTRHVGMRAVGLARPDGRFDRVGLFGVGERVVTADHNVLTRSPTGNRVRFRYGIAFVDSSGAISGTRCAVYPQRDGRWRHGE